MGVTVVAAEEDTASCGNRTSRTQRCMGIGKGGAAKRKIQKNPAQLQRERSRMILHSFKEKDSEESSTALYGNNQRR